MQMFKLATDSESKYRGTGYGKTVRPDLRGGRQSNLLSYLDCAAWKGNNRQVAVINNLYI
ncbi:hypothetical protein DDZ16_19855 [Marinilabilia rubra]|uniref:Uncharacterized protein n=1 Tax=Marinilabilia rubra TaxID=2162893 RepID=A0A2U2B3I6_9BACT|nr:hypothetical protein DDZ16_19855 [Marinilabilia rubra]